MRRRISILRVGTVKLHCVSGWHFGYDLPGMPRWEPELLAEISDTIGEGRSLVQCFFCGRPIVPREVPTSKELRNLCMRAFEEKPVRLGGQIGDKSICHRCYKAETLAERLRQYV